MKNYKILSHTADISVKVSAENIEKLFENCAKTLFDLLTTLKAKPTKKKKIILEASTLEDLLISWLNELLSIFYTYKFVPIKYNLKIKQNKLEARLEGSYFKNIGIKQEIKAATYHNLKIAKSKNKFNVNIIFDV